MKRVALISCLVLVVAFFSSAVFAKNIVVKSKPESAKECAICHYEMSDVFVYGGKTSPIAPIPSKKEVASDRMCFSCHDGSVVDSRLKVWNGTKKSHKTGVPLKDNMTMSTKLPLENGKITCATCHTAHGTENSAGSFEDIAGSRFLRMPIEDSQLCKACHADMSGKDSHPLKQPNKDYIMNILKKGGFLAKNGNVTCISCHSIHGSDEDKLLIASTKDMTLCRVCHEDLFNDPITGAPVKRPHITYVKPLDKTVIDTITAAGGKLLNDNTTMTCDSCHKVHKAKGKDILNFTDKDPQLCFKCHKGYDKMLTTMHNLTKTKNNFKTVDGKTPSEVGLCGTCHGGHKWNLDTSKTTSEDKVTGLCLNCHNNYGPAAKKAINTKMFNHYIGTVSAKLFDFQTMKEAKDVEAAAKTFLKTLTLDKNQVFELSAKTKVTCATCHDIHGNNYNFLRIETMEGKLCLTCHKNKSTLPNTSHGSAKLDDSCLSCHQIHNSPLKLLVRNGQDNDGCLTCHGEKVNKENKLPFSIVDGKIPDALIFKGHNHPTNIDNKTIFPYPAFNKNNGNFSCISCHDPHVSDNSSVMRGSFVRTTKDMKSPDDFCVVCHKDEKAVLNSSHVRDPKNKVIANKRNGRVAGTCDQCHKVHGAFADKYIPARKGTYNTPNDLCLTCHKENGDAKDKAIDVNKGHMIGKLDVKKIPTDIKTNYLTHDKGNLFLYCDNCHNPHKNGPKFGQDGNISNSFLKTLDNQTKGDVICVSCHVTQKTVKNGGHGISKFDPRNKNAKVKAQIKNNDICGVCHKMHNSPRKFLMNGVTSEERCLNCHGKDKMSSKHILIYHRDDVKVKGNPNLPLEKGKPVCKTCHNPHNENPYLVRGKSGKVVDLCLTCHKDKATVITSKHNMSINGIKDHKLLKLADNATCEPCHSSHDANSKTAINFKKISADGHHVENTCTGCHGKGKVAAKYIPECLRHPDIFKLLKAPKFFDNFTYGPNGRKAANGIIDCATCHDPHTWSTNPAKVKEFYKAGLNIKGDNSTRFLRGGVKDDFCVVCHDQPGQWYLNFHSRKYREERLEKKEPLPLLKRLFNMLH